MAHLGIVGAGGQEGDRRQRGGNQCREITDKAFSAREPSRDDPAEGLSRHQDGKQELARPSRQSPLEEMLVAPQERERGHRVEQGDA